MKDYLQANQAAREGGIVFYGSTYLSDIPLCELAQDFGCDVDIYNRSIQGLTIFDAAAHLKTCVVDLKPSKVFICIGDEDVKDYAIDNDRFIDQYRWLLYTMHNQCRNITNDQHERPRFYIISILSAEPAAAVLNDRLHDLADECGCDFVNASDTIFTASPALRLFDLLRFYLRRHPINFAEAMKY